jgi:hypothetical protein
MNGLSPERRIRIERWMILNEHTRSNPSDHDLRVPISSIRSKTRQQIRPIKKRSNGTRAFFLPRLARQGPRESTRGGNFAGTRRASAMVSNRIIELAQYQEEAMTNTMDGSLPVDTQYSWLPTSRIDRTAERQPQQEIRPPRSLSRPRMSSAMRPGCRGEVQRVPPSSIRRLELDFSPPSFHLCSPWLLIWHRGTWRPALYSPASTRPSETRAQKSGGNHGTFLSLLRNPFPAKELTTLVEDEGDTADNVGPRGGDPRDSTTGADKWAAQMCSPLSQGRGKPAQVLTSLFFSISIFKFNLKFEFHSICDFQLIFNSTI